MPENKKLTTSQIDYAFQRAVDAATYPTRDMTPKEAAEKVAVAALAAATILSGTEPTTDA